MKKCAKLAVLLFLMCLTGCSSKPNTIVKAEYVSPPQFLLQEYEVGKWQGGDVQDLAEHSARLRDALEQCNSDKRLLRDWDEAMQQTTEDQ